MWITGRLISVQEQRFRILTAEGQVYQLTLARDAPLDAADLASLHAHGSSVSVDFTGEPNYADGVAHSVQQKGHQ